MSYSLRRVLAARFSLTMLVALTLIAVWAMVGVERTLTTQVDRELLSSVSLLRARLGQGGVIPRQPEQDDIMRYVEEGSRLAILWDSSGSIVQSSLADFADFPLDTGAFRAALAGGTPIASESWRDNTIRSAFAPALPGTPAGGAVIQLVASLKPLGEASRDVLFAIAGTVLLGTLASAFGAFWLARSAVAPVVAVAEQARAISPNIGEARITVHADVDEYASLIGVLNALLERTGRAMATQRRFIGDVGHELRTPLAALQGSIEVALRSERTPRDYQLVLQDALEEVEHLGRMSESLLLITRTEGGLVQLHLAATDLHQVTRDLVDRLRRRVEEKGITIVTATEHAGPPPMLDEPLVSRALRELLENAVRFTPRDGRIAVGTSRSQGVVRWWVEDSGPGIPADDMPRLFEAFYRVDPARTRDSGSGLGLTLAASIARLHGGTIRAESPAAGGARFELEFPASTN